MFLLHTAVDPTLAQVAALPCSSWGLMFGCSLQLICGVISQMHCRLSSDCRISAQRISRNSHTSWPLLSLRLASSPAGWRDALCCTDNIEESRKEGDGQHLSCSVSAAGSRKKILRMFARPPEMSSPWPGTVGREPKCPHTAPQPKPRRLEHLQRRQRSQGPNPIRTSFPVVLGRKGGQGLIRV